MQLERATSEDLIREYRRVRQDSEALVAPLSEADAQLQSMPDASPAKWHLAHTTWFFETFLLEVSEANFQPVNPHYRVLFNSYYNGIGEQYKRPNRGFISRPSLAEVIDYRHAIDERVEALLVNRAADVDVMQTLTLGLNHEQQHQELLLMDIKHALFQNPMFPAYQTNAAVRDSSTFRPEWLGVEQGLYNIGHNSPSFAFDNEGPRHKVYVDGCKIRSHMVTNAEYLEFVKDGGYQNPALWLSDGWAWCRQNEAQQPLYWLKANDGWNQFSLFGAIPLVADEPVSHINYYEAQAYAVWAGCRLPTEYEWEVAVQLHRGKPVGTQGYAPQVPAGSEDNQWFAHLWQWTSSSYSPYPGFKPFAGAAGEYNGKFMSNQYVLRGSACVTPDGHARLTYRNFFYPHQAWAFTGLRLATD